MSWFEAWLIWRLGAIQDMMAITSGFFGTITVVFLIVWMVNYFERNLDDDEKRWIKLSKTWFFISLPILLISVSISVAIPDTETFFKIVATKYGADALTSEKAGGIGEGVLESIEKAQKLLNQKLDVLIDEKQVKQEEK